MFDVRRNPESPPFEPILRILAAIAVFLSIVAIASGQIDPRSQTVVTLLNNVTATTTSAPYAVTQLVANETILFQTDTPDGAVGTFQIEGTLDPEANVANDTAEWNLIFTTTSFGYILFLEDPPPYVRVRFTRTSGTFRCLMRAAGARFRQITVTP